MPQPDLPPSFGEPFARVFQKIREGLQAQQDQLSFQAEVVSFDPETLNAMVRRIGSVVDEGPYRIAQHVVDTIAAGQRVKIEDITGEGGFVVAYGLPSTAEPEPEPTTVDPIFVAADRFILDVGTPDLAVRGSGSATLLMPGWAFDAAAGEGVTTALRLTGFTSYTVTVYLACPNANAGNIVMAYGVAEIGVGQQIDQSDEASGSVTVASPAATDVMFTATFPAVSIVGNLVRFCMTRNGGSGSDTYASDVWFLGALITPQ